MHRPRNCPCEAAVRPVCATEKGRNHLDLPAKSKRVGRIFPRLWLQNPVRLSYKIKGGGRKRPPPGHIAPQCGAFPGSGKVVAKQRVNGFGWS